MISPSAPSRRVPRPWHRLALGALGILVCATAGAEVALSVAVEAIEGEGWRMEGVVVDLNGDPDEQLDVTLQLQQIDLPDGYGRIEGLHLACPVAVSRDGSWDCQAGRLAVQGSPIQTQDATWQGSYAVAEGLHLSIARLAVAQGTVSLDIAARDGVWTAQVRPHRARVSQLPPPADVALLPRDWGIDGRLSGLIALDGDAAGVSGVAADLVLDQLAYASPDGSQAAEKVVLKAELGARLQGAAWLFDAQLGWPKGALYAEPLFLDAGQGAAAMKVTGSWQPDPPRLQLDAWSVDLAETASISGTGRFAGDDFAISDLTIAARSRDAGLLYRRLLQPFLIGTSGDDMTVSGQVGLVLHFDGKGIEQAGLDFNGLALEDRQGRFSLDRTDGSVGWDRSKQVPVSRLTTQGVSLYRIPTSGFSISAQFAGDRIALVEPVVVPVLGGRVALESFTLTGALMAGESPHWEASASVRGVSLEELTRLLEWPPFNGTVSGQLRNMRYDDQVFSVGGGLELVAFEGRIQVDNLRIQDPFGTVPILQADATLRDLNLLALTETFSFGRIEGRLDGDVKGIQLVGWQPNRFDLHLYTPADDDSRHRISQRAVQNLTELGSGVPAGLSATFLSVFEEFRYDRIDVKVLLQGDRAELDGLARPDGGYYLVRGSGLPRIDVIGRNRSVAWKDLVERLQQIQVEGAQIR